MKKRELLVLCIPFLMTGCAWAETNSQPEVMTGPSQTEPISEHSGFRAQNDDTAFRVSDKIVEVIKNGEVVQTLECDWTANMDSVAAEDFDFDGYDDLFIRMEHGAMYAPGTYFRFVPDTLQYEKWDVLNSIGKELLPDHEEQTLMYRENESEHWIEYYVYAWDNDSLVLTEHTISEDGAVFETLPID
ncbi:MAG: hypothetical protein IJ265_12065 [Oscillospiraceae bacterium]|nr:hypothetical protein [Oscillospiraceae bacterium]